MNVRRRRMAVKKAKKKTVKKKSSIKKAREITEKYNKSLYEILKKHGGK